jgi:hypothetical protein
MRATDHSNWDGDEMIRPSFTQSLAKSVSEIPRSVVASMFAVGVIMALIDVWYWAEGWKSWPTGMWVVAPEVLAISVVEYLGIIGILGLAPSLHAYIRFASASAVLFLPLVLAVAVLFAAPIIGKIALLVFFFGLVAGLVILAFLPAWPVAQSVTALIISPNRVFKATRGFRWGLVGAAILLSVFNRQDIIPEVDKATDIGHAFAYAAGQAGMSALSMIYTAAVGATAFIFVCRNDEGLYPPHDGTPASKGGRVLRFGV